MLGAVAADFFDFMIKLQIQNIVNQFGYQITKVEPLDKAARRSVADEQYFKKKVGDNLAFYETPNGKFYLPLEPFDDAVASAIRRGFVFEDYIVDEAKKFVKENTAVLDVGSNFGQMAVLFSKMVGENGLVYAFEADDYVFEILKMNLAANDCKNVIPVFGAVYHEAGKKLFFPKQDFERFGAFGSYGIDPNATEGRTVESLKIDDINFEKPISFMKIDVQGSDLFAMQGARETIKKHQMPILFEFEQQFQDEFDTSFQDYVSFVGEQSYKFCKVVQGINYLIAPQNAEIR